MSQNLNIVTGGLDPLTKKFTETWTMEVKNEKCRLKEIGVYNFEKIQDLLVAHTFFMILFIAVEK